MIYVLTLGNEPSMKNVVAVATTDKSVGPEAFAELDGAFVVPASAHGVREYENIMAHALTTPIALRSSVISRIRTENGSTIIMADPGHPQPADFAEMLFKAIGEDEIFVDSLETIRPKQKRSK